MQKFGYGTSTLMQRVTASGGADADFPEVSAITELMLDILQWINNTVYPRYGKGTFTLMEPFQSIRQTLLNSEVTWKLENLHAATFPG